MKINRYNVFASLAFIAALGNVSLSSAQGLKRKVLFIGNSYTASNFLPNLVREVAQSAGDTLITDFIAPGGFTFEMHSADMATRAKIDVGDWNYVVLQEQSQRPAFSDAQVAAEVYPFARTLDSLVHAKNKCGRSVFFQTWGYKNGDAGNCPIFPPICTYKGMDSLLELRYQKMALDNDALLSPVGMVFKEIRSALPSVNLYELDESHPSIQGSYAAAVTFYTILLGKNPTLITFNAGLPPAEANQIRQVVLLSVYSKLAKFGVGSFDPNAAFTYLSAGPKKMDFNSATSQNAINYNWNFGDGGTSTLANPSHTYAATGTYSVRLIVDDCMKKDTSIQSVIVPVTGSISDRTYLDQVSVYPNPAQNVLHIVSASPTQKIKVSIANLLGSVILHSTEVVAQSMDISSLSSGIYVLTIQDETSGTSITRKFVKE
jgi:hypothetical protein